MPVSLRSKDPPTTPLVCAPCATAPLERDDFDRLLHALEGKATMGLSPAALWLATLDWAIHLANAPHRRLRLAQSWAEKTIAIAQMLGGQRANGLHSDSDHRFQDPAWQSFPFNVLHQSFLQWESWWAEATTDVRGVDRANQRIVAFAARQWLDMLSPSNLPWLNPEVIAATNATGGRNLIEGFNNLLSDLGHGTRPDDSGFTLGRDLATTAGQVILRNDLVELIQYAPTTDKVHPEPILIVPAWIMKYYILDLSPHNSLIGFLVAQGFTVFCLSWRNPTAEQAQISLDDYRRLGVMAALDAIVAVTGSDRIHAGGYCLGGTLLSVAAAAMARDGDKRLASLTLLAAQTDFTEAGELQLFVTESQLAFLEDVMWAQGSLTSDQMAGAFQMLRSNDLIWSRLVKSYLLGQPDQPNDLMAWNRDATRMPYRMHADYLRHMFLNNDLAEGRFPVDGRPVSIEDIQAPIFCVGTVTDHVAPWRSVHRIHLLNNGDITFVLTSGGHNAGIVSEPGHPHRRFQLHRRVSHGRYIGPDEWRELAASQEGSWWPSWSAWLKRLSGPVATPPPLGSADRGYPPLAAAPGRYVLES